MQRSKIKRALGWLTVLAFYVLLIWSTDEITLQGERTIYTVLCKDGAWEGLRCPGKMTAGERYRYRASQSRHEVVFWIAGSPIPSGKYTDCTVKDRGHWSCSATLQSTPSITQEMMNDRAVHGPAGLTIEFHAVPKWKWWLLRAGIRVFDEAAY